MDFLKCPEVSLLGAVGYFFSLGFNFFVQVYGSAVTFYENYPEENLTPEQLKQLDPGEFEGGDCAVGNGEEMTYHVNKCICILSHWPFFDTFEKFLLFIYKMSRSGSHPVPIERCVSIILIFFF